jgi:hypothetical protein
MIRLSIIINGGVEAYCNTTDHLHILMQNKAR